MELHLWKSVMIKKSIFNLLLILMAGTAWAQSSGQNISQPFTLEQAYERLEQNYPVADKAEIQRQITELNRKIARSGLIPELQIQASTSYQSDVTDFPFSTPGSEVPTFSKDHYNFSLDVTQPIYDGGRVRTMQESEQHAGNAELARIRSSLLNVRMQLEQAWFGILMMQKQVETLKLLHDDIREQLEQVQALVRNGVLLPGEAQVMEAEQIRVEQELAGIRGDIRAGYRVLSEILGVELSMDRPLEVPEDSGLESLLGNEIRRPEFQLFDSGALQLEAQKNRARADQLPSLSLFTKSAYGRPGLNAFDDDLQLYWVVGLRARWSFRNTRNASMKQDILNLQQRNLESDRQAFTRQLQAELRKAEEEMEAIRRQIEQDEKVLKLREKVVEEKRKQLERGVITSTEYMMELNAETRARTQLELRKIRLAKTITEYKTKRGQS
ncbi:MAG: TolC family protein [Balneolaceae bacterium]